MARVSTTIDDDVEKKFRKMAQEKFGYKKGAIKGALEEAVMQWMENPK